MRASAEAFAEGAGAGAGRVSRTKRRMGMTSRAGAAATRKSVRQLSSPTIANATLAST